MTEMTGRTFVLILGQIESMRLSEFITVYGGNEKHGLGQHLFHKLYRGGKFDATALFYFDCGNREALIKYCIKRYNRGAESMDSWGGTEAM